MLKIVKVGPKNYKVEGDLDKAANILMVTKEELLSYPAYYEGTVNGENISFEKNADAIAFIGLVQSQVKINKAFGVYA